MQEWRNVMTRTLFVTMVILGGLCACASRVAQSTPKDASLDDASTARAEAEELLARPFGILPPMFADDIVEEFSLGEHLHAQAIALGHSRLREYAHELGKSDPCAWTDYPFVVRHPLPECSPSN